MKNILLIGASGGIGNKVAENLLAENYYVTGTYFNNEEKIENLKSHKNFLPIKIDLTPPTIKNLQKIFEKDKINLYAVVNCSGIVDYECESLEKDIEIWNKTIATNLTSNYLLGKIFFKSLEENGRFIMISSTDAYFGGAITASYAAAKAGINSLTKSFSLLFADKKIRVNSIAPGWVETPMIEVNGGEFIKKVAEINPLKRNAKPQDVANLIKFLLSEESNYINGQVISLEGGYTNQDPTLLLEQAVQEKK